MYEKALHRGHVYTAGGNPKTCSVVASYALQAEAGGR